MILALLVASWLSWLYEKPEPNVSKGNALAAQNDPEGALK